MKKLLALVLSIAMVLTMFSGTLGVFAADSASLTPKAYNGSLPQSSAATWGFEDASLLTPTAEQNNVYMIAGNYGGTPKTENAGITTEEKVSGNSSLYATFNGAGYAHFLIDVTNPADLAAWVTANKDYHIKADVKTTADFNGGVYFHLLKDGASIGVHDWYGEYFFYQTDERNSVAPTETVLTNWTTVIGKNPGRSAIQAKRIADWISGSKLQIRVMITGNAGSIWLDNFDLIDASTTTKKYDGVFTRDTQNLTRGGESHNNGGFEEDAGYYDAKMLPDHHTSYDMNAVLNEAQNPNVIISENVSSGKKGAVQVTNKYAHSGRYSLKMYKAEEAVGGWAVAYPTEYLSAEKDYYLEAYVKLDDFNGNITAGSANNGPSFINSVYQWFGDNYMLGNKNTKLTKEDVGTGWIHITSQVMDGATIVEKATGTGVKFFINLTGVGTLYVDDINLIEVNDYTPAVSTASYYGNVNFDRVTLTTAGDADIWFTTDGSDPLTSTTAKRYDAANPIRVYDNLTLKYAGIDKATGAASSVISQYYFSPADMFKVRESANTAGVVDDKVFVYYNTLTLPADAAEGDIVRLTYEEATSKNDDGSLNYTTKDAVMQFRGYEMNNSVNVTFDVTAAEGFTGESWVKLWLNGGGEHIAQMNGDTVNGTFVGRDGYVAKVTEAGTQTVTLKLEGLQKHDAMAPYIERISGSGAVTVDNFKITIDQVGAPIIEVVEEEAPAYDYYIEDYYTDVFPLMTNNSAYDLNGVMEVVYTDQDGEDVFSKTYDIKLASGESYSDWFDISEVITEYGAYDLQYIYHDVSGMSYVCLEKTIAYLPDNSASESFRGVNLGVFGGNYDTAFANLELVKNLGMNYVRTEIKMENANLVTVEEDGSYTLADTVLNGAEAAMDAGVKLVVLLNASYKTVDVNEFAKFAAAAKAQLADYGIEYFELINEPNGGDAAKYAAIVKAAYPVLADDTTKVLAGNVSHHGAGWLEGMIAAEADILDYIDIWAVHPYSHNNFSDNGIYEDVSFRNYLATLKAEKLDPNGIELWAGEFGFPTANTCQRDKTGLYPFTSEETVAEKTLRQYLGLEADSYGAAMQYAFSGDNNYWGEQSFGLVAKQNKTTVAALSAYTNFTEGYDFVEQTVVDGVYTNKYQNADGAVVYAVWTIEGEKEATVSVPAYDYGVADMYGKKGAAAKVPNGNAFDLTLTATTEPTWVVDYTEPYIEPLDSTYIKNASIESDTLHGDWATNMKEGRDNVIKYDGDYSFRIDFNGKSANNRRYIDLNLANVDVSKRYVLRYKYKTNNVQLGGNLYVSNDAGVEYKMGRWNGELENSFAWTEVKTTAGWETFESQPFSIMAGNSFRLLPYWCQNADCAGTIWVDRFELVPVDDTVKHGKVTLSKGDDGAIYATATPDEGYAVLDVKFQGTNIDKGSAAFYNMKNTLVSEDIANRAKTYKLEMVAADDETLALNVFYKGSALQHVTATFVPADEMPIDVLDGDVSNGSLETLPGFWSGADQATLDNLVRLDGEASIRIDFKEGSAAGTTFVVSVPKEKMAELDASKNYKLTFYAKSKNGTFHGFLGNDIRWNGRNAEGVATEIMQANWLYGGDYPLLNDGTIGTKWTKFETKEFPMLGDDTTLLFVINNRKAVTEESVWIDRIELVPVENNKDYTVTTDWDETAGKLLATVTADEGKMIDTFKAQGATGYGNDKIANAAWELVAQNAVNEVVYAVDFTGVDGFWQGHTFNIFEATTKDIPAGDAAEIVVGDATGDGKVDVLDLVRFKNFELGNTAEIDYVNVWYDRADNILGATDFTALLKQLWAMF